MASGARAKAAGRSWPSRRNSHASATAANAAIAAPASRAPQSVPRSVNGTMSQWNPSHRSTPELSRRVKGRNGAPRNRNPLRTRSRAVCRWRYGSLSPRPSIPEAQAAANANASAPATARSALRRPASGTLRHRAQPAHRRIRRALALFVVLGVLVDAPDVVHLPPGEDVLHRQHGGHHRMVLVVVLVHPIAPGEVQGRETLLHLAPDHFDVRGIARVVDRVGLGLADDAAVEDLVARCEPDLLQLAGGESEQVGVGRAPEPVSLEAEVLEAVAAEGGVGHHLRRPGLEVLDPPDLHARVVDVDPVVVEPLRVLQDEHHGEEVAVAQGPGGVEGAPRKLRPEHAGKASQRDRGDYMLGDELLAGAPARGHHRPAAGGSVVGQLVHGRAHQHPAALGAHLLGTRFPHHPGTLARVAEGLDERLDDLAAQLAPRQERAERGRREGQALDPLRRPVGGDLLAGHAPHLLGVGLEEDLEEPPAELGDHPILEAARRPVRCEAGARVRERAARRLQRAQLDERLGSLERIAEEPALVVDARGARPQEEVVRQDLRPQVLDLFRFGKEAMAADIEMESFVVLCARDSAHVAGIALEDRCRDALLAEEVCGGQARRARAEDRNLRLVHLQSDASMGSMHNPVFGNGDPKRVAPTFASADAPVAGLQRRALRALIGWTAASALVCFALRAVVLEDVRPGAKLHIFWHLFLRDEPAAAVLGLGVALAAVLIARLAWPAALDGALERLAARPWTFIAAATATLAVAAVVVYHRHPLSMDEYAPLFQARAFARGSLWGEVPPEVLPRLIPIRSGDFLEASLDGRVISSYWPGFALLLAPFPALGANAISFYSMSAHLLFNLLFVSLILEPEPRRLFAAGAVGSFALALHNPVPHLLFALPWMAWIGLRQGGARRLAALLLGYVPLSALLGLGWLWVRSRLAGTTAQGPGPVELAAGLARIAFNAPGLDLVLARAAGLIELILWAVPGLLLVASWGALRSLRRTGDRRLFLLALSGVCTLAGYMFVPFNQGHGWGFRYFHSAWGVVPLLAAAFLTSPDVQKTFLPRAMLVCAALSLALGTGLRFAQVRGFIEDHLAQLPRAATSQERRVVFVHRDRGYYSQDLVQNDPFLDGSRWILLSAGDESDAQWMRRAFPGSRRIAANEVASVWAVE